MKRTLLLIALISLLVLPTFGQKWDTINATNSACVVGACVYVDLDRSDSFAVVQVTGTFTATLQFEGSVNGSTFVSISGTPSGGGSAVTSATAAGAWRFTVSGYKVLRVRASAYTSGTATVKISVSNAASSVASSSSLPDAGADGACLVSSSGEWARGDCAGTPATDPTPAVTEDTDSVNSTKGIEAPSVTTTGSAAYVQIPDGGTAGANKFTSAGGAVKWGTLPVTQTVASGTATLGTTSIAAGQCASVVTVSATGVATTDVISWTPNADISGVTGYATTGTLRIYPYPSANNVNFKVCNADGTNAVTPGAVTLNWKVSR